MHDEEPAGHHRGVVAAHGEDAAMSEDPSASRIRGEVVTLRFLGAILSSPLESSLVVLGESWCDEGELRVEEF